MGLLFTFITGLFFLVGILLNKLCHNKDNINVFAIALAFVVLLNLILFDIGPEVFESISLANILFVILGIGLLKLMDLLVPHHHHEHHEVKDNHQEHELHLEHISIVTILALTIHNMIECMALYNISANVKAGLLMTIGIGLHNIPLGFQIGSSLNKNRALYIFILTISGFLGGLLCLAFTSFSDLIMNYILSFTLGMIIYLTLFELAHELYNGRKNKFSLYGIIVGVIIIIVSRFI